MVLVYGDRVVLGTTLDDALDQLFGAAKAVRRPSEAAVETVPTTEPAPGAVADVELETVREVLQRILDLDKEAEAARGRGDFETFLKKNQEQSEALKELEATLQ